MRGPRRKALMASERAEENKLVLRRASAALASRDFELAARLYKGLLKDDPENRDVLFALGDVYVKSGDDARALPYYEKINKNNPNDTASLNALGAIYRRLGRFDDSLRVLRTALSIGGSNAEVNYNLGFTYRSMGDYDRAVECFESVIASDPADTLAYNHLGAIYARRKEYQKAATAYKRGLQVDPNHPVLQLNLAETYEALHAYGEAANAYEAALRAKPGWTEAVQRYTALLLRLHKTAAAASVVEKAIALHPSDAHLFSLLGRVERRRFDYEAAVRAFKKASAFDPENSSFISCLADAYEKNGALENAAALMRQAEKKFPLDEAVAFQYVCTLLSAGDDASAFAKLKALYAKNQNDVQILDLYGQYCLCKGESEKADVCYKKINSIDAQYFAYEKSAAFRSLQTGRFDTARNYITRYLAKYPHDEEALVLSAKIDTAEGKLSSALDTYRAVLAVDDGNVLANSEVTRIAELLAEAEAAKNDYPADESDEKNGAEIVMDSPETKALEAAVYEPAHTQETPFDFDLMGESLLKADDEIDPFTMTDRESDEEMQDSEADGLDLLISPDRPIDRDASSRSAGNDDVFDGRTGPAAGLDETVPGNIDDGFGTETIDAEFEMPVVLPRSKAKYVNYEDEPISVAEDVPARRPLPESPPKAPIPLPGAAEAGIAAPRRLAAALDTSNVERASELAALRRSYDEAHRTSRAARDAAEDAIRLIDTAKKSAERIRTDAALAESNVKDATEDAMKKIREAAEKTLSEMDGKRGEIIERKVQKKVSPQENASEQTKAMPRNETFGKERVPQLFDGARCSDQVSAELTAVLEKAMHALPDIAAALQNKKSADQFAIELELFKKLRTMCGFLPVRQKEKFMSSKTRLLLDYVIARLSGRPGLLATAEVLRKIKLPLGLLETNGTSPFTSLTDEQLVPLVIHDMRTKLADLPDASLASALDEAASKALENARNR